MDGQGMLTDAELEAFVQQEWSKDVTLTRIALMAGVSQQKVRRVADRLHLSPRGVIGASQEVRDRIRELWDTGLSVRKIGAEVGMNANQVIGHVTRLGLPRRPNPVKRAPGAPVFVSPGPMREAEKVAVAIARTDRLKKEKLATAVRRVEEVATAEKAAVIQPAPSVRTCQWLDGHPRLLNFCGKPAIAGRPYCAEHTERAYIVRSNLVSV